MKKVTIYGKSTCPYTVRAINLFKRKNIDFSYIDLNEHPVKRDIMIKLSSRTTVPQIWIDAKHIGGCDELYKLEEENLLNYLLKIND